MHAKAPPIQWLPVFEAAARLCSFKKAADELCVTPPAISQQIKALEDYLGITLFDRTERRLKLTPAGQHYYLTVQQIIKMHVKSYYDLERRFKNPILQVSVPLYIAQEILIPNFLSFRKRAPEIDLRLTTGSELVDFDNDTVDAAIRFGDGNWPELECRPLLPVTPILVCSPKYLSENNLNTETYFDASVLKKQVIISLREDLQDWQQALPELDPADKIICDSYFSVIKSAEEGLGIAIGLLPIINKSIGKNHLVPLSSPEFRSDVGYWLVAPKPIEDRPAIVLFYDWLADLLKDFSA
ncbi:MAG: LysR substrate-binding domain-containing protein [Pseudomonadales bacterium]|uniref:DNA-binding transcriptional dual regulator n=1 Tax=Oleiphilus messinensis TaxID=141451 RepID=A0A1Y0IF72_9GAMM|nr:LysR substrate-binding domain-containing protein [Oleiphilus messinensis]ARU58446.1 DNA-binding transcriptional dual regulator [Oleiphilus messinensis]MCG8611558.1 LysR substrate-binding domain-containing protein [Pseudomonadales bacterium]